LHSIDRVIFLKLNFSTMPRTNEQIDKMNVIRKERGLDPLPYETASASGNPTGDNPNQGEQPKVDPVPPTAADSQDETEEQLLEKLNKRAGTNFKSLDDFKPKAAPEDQEKIKKERASKKLAYGLQNGLVTTEEYEGFVKDYQNSSAVVYDSFKQEILSESPTLSDQEIRDLFDEQYHLQEDSASPKYKRGQKAIEAEAEKILRERHAKVLGLDSAYEAHEKETGRAAQDAAKIKAGMPGYRKAVTDALATAGQQKVVFGNGEEYQVAIQKEDLDAIEQSMLADATAQKHILEATSLEQIKSIIELSVLRRTYQKQMESVATQALIKHGKGTKGVPEGPTGRAPQESGGRTYTEAQKKALDERGMSHVYTGVKAN
jgi:hypothetical protein